MFALHLPSEQPVQQYLLSLVALLAMLQLTYLTIDTLIQLYLLLLGSLLYRLSLYDLNSQMPL